MIRQLYAGTRYEFSSRPHFRASRNLSIMALQDYSSSIALCTAYDRGGQIKDGLY